ncbi:MAG: type IV pilus assembly protein PilM [Candidatus Magasanikbacteria bacterium]|nr:type IV pilus assembly protein PilM [Candidatus Magasanikbacteria bacterium]
MWPFSKPQNFLGVDIGSNGIKLVELQKKGKHAYLFTYGFSDKNLLAKEGDGFLEIEATSSLLKQVSQKAKTVSKTALASLPASSVYSALLTIPSLKKEDKIAFINRQVEKLIPLPLKEVVIDWKPVKRFDKNKNKPQIEDKIKIETEEIFFTAAPKKIIAAYVEIFRKAGLTLLSLESEPLALASSLIGKDLTPILVIDMGARQTDFLLVERGVPVLFHTLKIGGVSFTQIVQKTFGVEEKEAEQIKRDLKNEKKFPAIFTETVSPMVEAIRYIFELYGKQKENVSARPEKIILTGGSSLLPHLDSHLGEIFSLKTYLGDPWARVIYAEELKPVLDSVGPRFATALGLALKKIEG